MGEELSRIPDLSYSRPDGAFYYFVDVSRYGDSLELAREILKRRKVVTVPGEAFGANGKGWLRLSYACSEQGIREGVRRIAEELKTG
jgi:aspartate/methionine/tyrosine aminotransferase